MKKILCAAYCALLFASTAQALTSDFNIATINSPGAPMTMEKINRQLTDLVWEARADMRRLRSETEPEQWHYGCYYYHFFIRENETIGDYVSITAERELYLAQEVSATCSGYVFDIRTGERVSAKDYAASLGIAPAILTARVIECLKKMGIDYDERNFRKQWANGAYENFYTSMDGMTILFPADSIAPGPELMLWIDLKR